MSLHPRIESAIRTAKQWESDKSLLTEIRTAIPFEDLVPELCVPIKDRCQSFLHGNHESKNEDGDAVVKLRESLTRNDDTNYEGDDLLLKRLTLYFKREIMTWVNAPPCINPNCSGNEDGKKMKNEGVRGPQTEEEKNGQATRVEMYTCQLCNASTTFPRFNSPRALFKSRRGRCGEFANLFGTFCRSVGYDTRYCLDLTDHVWVEVWSVRQGKWLHADSCEGLIDRPNMYEQGWGKKLSYVIGATHDSVADITKRYTRKFYSDDFQTRRREYSPDENTSDRAFLQMNATIKQMINIPKGRMEELEKRSRTEDKFFGLVQSSGVWDEDYKEGRISGSYAWKSVRGELGESDEKQSDSKKVKEESQEVSFVVESFYPAPNSESKLTILVKHPSKASHECIIVNGVPCASILPNETSTSIVVIDELSGCILQSRAFSSWTLIGSFIDTVPDGRVVALTGNGIGNIAHETTIKHLQRVGGLLNSTESLLGPLLFVGQVGYNPKWTTVINTTDTTKTVRVTIQLNTTSILQRKLRSEKNTTPATISARLPETIMSLKTQIAANEFQKRVAFEAFMNQSDLNSIIVGYTTRPEAPVYLIDNDSFPMRHAGGTALDRGPNNSSWTTYHYLPDALVSDEDVINNDSESKSTKSNNLALYDIPIAEEYFVGLLGSELLVKNGTSSPSLTNTSIALENTRLVALYFSAHWCGPCRGFTPMLSEFYTFLKEEVAPTHGLEIVFVSSDRNEAEFEQYYSSMPFKSLPFANRALAQQLKSVFGVRGIPSLVVIDTMSGQIAVSPDESRREVHQACSMGEQAIERLFNTWLDKVPDESKAMLDILALSCQEAKNADTTDGDAGCQNLKADDYLVRKPETAEVIIKKIFTELVASGMTPNDAAAEAIKRSSIQSVSLTEGPLKAATGHSDVSLEIMSVENTAEAMLRKNHGDKAKLTTVLSTAKKYVTNVQKDETNSRFRVFRLSNRVFDQITSVPGSITLLRCIGFSVFSSDIDFVASIPLSTDLKAMVEVLDKLLEVYAT